MKKREREMRDKVTESAEQRAGSRMEDLLRRAVPPIAQDALPVHDLWPSIKARLHEDPVIEHSGVPWFDWALAAGLIGFLLLFPYSIPMFLYYL